MHTRFAEYIKLRLTVPVDWTFRFLRWFHTPASCTLVRTGTQFAEMDQRGFKNLRIWPGAVDTALFYPRGKDALALPRPISMYMGRVSVEKNLEAFLSLDIPGSKVVVGDGPSREMLEEKYPEAYFLGARSGDELVETVSAADVFVFPSKTDTFGLVMLEAMACGVPVAAYPVQGPVDVVTNGTGSLDEDLRKAVFGALAKDPDACVTFAQDYNWSRSTDCFLSAQEPIDWRGDIPVRIKPGPHWDKVA